MKVLSRFVALGFGRHQSRHGLYSRLSSFRAIPAIQ